MAHERSLERFVTAQQDVWPQAREELRRGRKASHWMWFVFPQLAGLGRSSTAQYYALADADEARAYLAHPVLGPRLREAAQLAAEATAASAEQLMGGIDAMKLRSSMTLFADVAPDDDVFAEVLRRWYHGEPDPLTLQLLRG